MLILENGRLVDGSASARGGPCHVLVEGDTIREVSGKPIKSMKADRLDLEGRTIMPGLIDCHVHVIATIPDLGANAMLPDSLITARSAMIMRDMIMRGFTTVRDVGGADYGLKRAVADGLLIAPRLNISGKALSQTGGHTDYRGRFDQRPFDYIERRLGALGRIANGVDAVRSAAREEIKGGADFIKVMANGGVSSPTDPIAFLSYSIDELKAIVEEASNAKTYVCGHLYTDEAIRRAVECGVHSVEHGNLVTSATAKLMRQKGACVVPTLVTFDALAKEGAGLGLPPESVAKIEDVRGAGLRSLEIFRKSGVLMGYGTDLLGVMHRHQSEEFVIRSQVLPAHEIIASATLNAAKILRMEGKIGTIAPGAFADIIVINGDPLKDIKLLTGQGRHMPLIMKGGAFIKNSMK